MMIRSLIDKSDLVNVIKSEQNSSNRRPVLQCVMCKAGKLRC